jgi:hypothetical protein
MPATMPEKITEGISYFANSGVPVPVPAPKNYECWYRVFGIENITGDLIRVPVFGFFWSCYRYRHLQLKCEYRYKKFSINESPLVTYSF